MRILKLAAMAALSLASIAGPAQAAAPAGSGPSSNGSNCWGVVSAQLAEVEGGLGEHTSSQTLPRLGLGNVARLFFEMGLIDDPSVSALGSFLASLDEYDETTCAVQ